MKKVSKEKPLISVIVPVYNVEEYLPKCIDSIINQTYRNLEIILVDDGSPDNSPKICDEYAKKDKRIKVIHKKNGGVSSARNYGIKESTGEFISFVDADDWVDRKYIEVLYSTSIEYNSDYVCCGYNRVYNNKKEEINSTGDVIEYTNNEYLIKLLNVQNSYGFCHMKLIKKNALKSVRFDEKLLVGEDALFNVMLCNNISKAVVVNKPLYNYRFNSNSVVRKYDANYVTKYENSMKKMSKYIGKNYKDVTITQQLYNYIAYHVLLISVNYCFHPLNKNQLSSIKNVCNISLFKEAIKKSNYDSLSLSRKISLFTLKYKLYLIMAIICMIRQYQFKNN